MIARRELRAMGTTVELFLRDVPDTEAAFEAAEAEFERLEALMSRFRDDSELSQLNRAGRGRVDADLFRVVELAVEARERTAGRFDPTVHDAVVAAGYDRTFELVAPDGADAGGRARCGGAVALDRSRLEIELEPDTRLDLGGIGKGYAADRACAILAAFGPCLVNAGGDVAASGGPWPVGAETTGTELTLELTDGAIATTGRDRRRWRRNGDGRHHVVDPRTGAPSTTDLLRVTVVASTAVEGEVLAKALFLAGADGAAREADETATPAILVTAQGRTLLAGGLA